jgi:hypothetical protein
MKIKRIKKLPRERLGEIVLEGVDLIGYHKKSDSYVIKCPIRDVYWIVSKAFIEELK